MHLVSRAMQLKDVRLSAAVVAESGLERKAYGRYLDRLPAAWTRCLREGSIMARVIEDMDQVAAGVLGVGVSAFVSDEFVAECKTAPLPWLGPTLLERVGIRNPPMLRPAAVRQANSGDGLNIAVWAGSIRRASNVPAFDLAMELGRAFYVEHQGYRLKEIISQPLDPQILRYTVNTGACLLLDDRGRETKTTDISAEFIARPFLLSFTRETVLQNPGSRNAELFHEEPARIFFSDGEQRLLLAAIRGGTDEELADELGLSLSAVKKLWRSVYDRVASTSSDLLPSRRDSENERGKEKKHKLLAYLRDHPRELRPLQRPKKHKN